MKADVKAEIKRIALKLGMGEKVVEEKMKEYMEQGFNELSAIGQVKGEFGYLLQRINGAYRIYPLKVGRLRTGAWKNKEGVVEDHDVIDIMGAFYGKVSKMGQDTGFLLQMSLVDEDVKLASGLDEGELYVFKGSLDTGRQKIYLQRGAEFLDEKDADVPTMGAIVSEASKNAAPLYSLWEEDDKGEYTYHKVNVLVSGFINDVREVGSEGRSVLEVTDLGADICTVWPPDGEEYTKEAIGQRVLISGWNQMKDNGPSISAKVIIAVEATE